MPDFRDAGIERTPVPPFPYRENKAAVLKASPWSNSRKSAQRLSNRIALVKAVLFCHSALALFLE
ncbi:hypothetical protein ACC720_30325, partial [Rhizobium ruizarguesonis]